MSTEPTLEMAGQAQTLSPTTVETAKRRSKAWRRWVPLAGLVLAITIFHLGSLVQYPPIFVDEAWMASRAWGWLQTGLNVSPLDGIAFSQLESFETVKPLFVTLLHALTIQLGGLSVTSLRVVSLVFGGGLLIAVYFITYELGNSRRSAFLSVALTATSLSFFTSSHLVRPDIFVATLGYGALAIYLLGRREDLSIIPELTAGLLIGLAFEIHPNAVIYGPIILTLLLMDHAQSFYRRIEFWAFIAGSCAGLSIYVWLHILPNPETYFTVMSAAERTHHPPALNGYLPILTSLLDTSRYLFRGTATRIVGTGLAAIILWRKNKMTYSGMLAIFIIGILAFALFVRHKGDYYLILITPLSNIILGSGTAETLKWGNSVLLKNRASPLSKRLARFFSKTLLYSTIVLSLILTFNTVRKSPPPGDLERITEQVQQIVPQGGGIWGPHTYWFGLYDHPYTTWQQTRAYVRFHPSASFDDAMAALHPDILIVDDFLRLFILPDHSSAPRYFQERRISKKDFDTFVKRRGTMTARFDTDRYGTIEIYSIRWNDNRQSTGVAQ